MARGGVGLTLETRKIVGHTSFRLAIGPGIPVEDTATGAAAVAVGAAETLVAIGLNVITCWPAGRTAFLSVNLRLGSNHCGTHFVHCPFGVFFGYIAAVL